MCPLLVCARTLYNYFLFLFFFFSRVSLFLARILTTVSVDTRRRRQRRRYIILIHVVFVCNARRPFPFFEREGERERKGIGGGLYNIFYTAVSATLGGKQQKRNNTNALVYNKYITILDTHTTCMYNSVYHSSLGPGCLCPKKKKHCKNY